MSNVAHFCLQKLHILPSDFNKLSTREKAFIIASVQIRIDNEKEALKKVKRGRK